MRSPFPGMDPYLEKHWGDVHASLIFLARSQLQKQLPADLAARIEERIFVDDESPERRAIEPDVRISESHPSGTSGSPASGAAVAEPLIVSLESDPITETYIKIVDVKSSGKVITSIEFLSPANKTKGEGRDKFEQKRSEMRAGGVNLVEIDLTRSGQRHMLLSPFVGCDDPRMFYQAHVWRAAKPRSVELYGFPLREALLAIRIPLRKTDMDVILSLQPLIDKCYEEGRFDTIDYSLPAEPRLQGEDVEWANQMIDAWRANQKKSA